MNVLRNQDQIHILGESYSLQAIVRNFSGHFTCAAYNSGCFHLLDDLQMRIPTFSNVEEIYQHHVGGWFFGVYVKGEKYD